MKKLGILAAGLPIVFAAGAAQAGSFTGKWQLTVSRSHYGNGTYCLALTDDGSLGWRHSGEASLSSQGGSLPYGTFQLIERRLVVTIQDPGLSGQNAGLVFDAPANGTSIGKGDYDEVYGGEEFDSGVVAFGAKGGC